MRNKVVFGKYKVTIVRCKGILRYAVKSQLQETVTITKQSHFVRYAAKLQL